MDLFNRSEAKFNTNSIKLPKAGFLARVGLSLTTLLTLFALTSCGTEVSASEVAEQIKEEDRTSPIFHDESTDKPFPLDIIYRKLFEYEQKKIFEIISQTKDSDEHNYCDVVLLPYVEIYDDKNEKPIQQLGGIYMKPREIRNINGITYSANEDRGLVITEPDSSSTHEFIHCAIHEELNKNTEDKFVKVTVSLNDRYTVSFNTLSKYTYLILDYKDIETGESTLIPTYFFEEIYTQILTKYFYKLGVNNVDKFDYNELLLDDFTSQHVYEKGFLDLLTICEKYNLKYDNENIDIAVLQKLLMNELSQGGSAAVFSALTDSKKGTTDYQKILIELSDIIMDFDQTLTNTTSIEDR